MLKKNFHAAALGIGAALLLWWQQAIAAIPIQHWTQASGAGIYLVESPTIPMVDVQIDFDALEKLSKVAREEYGMCGAVQHGASTLPEEAFGHVPRTGTAEVHLATGFQNIIYDSQYFPTELSGRIHRHLLEKYSAERKPQQTDQQFIYSTRKKAFGDFKKELWSLPEESLRHIMAQLEGRFSLLFEKLNVVGTKALVRRFVG